MLWLNKVISKVTGKKYDIDLIKANVNTNAAVTDAELDAYIDDIDKRIKNMEKELKGIYSKYGVTFEGFKSLDSVCVVLHDSINDGKEVAYNNLIKLESAITLEHKSHLSLLHLAITTNGKNILDEINCDPISKEVFTNVFGNLTSSKEMLDGLYQQLWSEIHKLSEYVIVKKNKVYH